jgi:hypothetical protein
MRALLDSGAPAREGACDGNFDHLEVLVAMRNTQDDPAVHKGAIEGDRPTDIQFGNPNAPGIDDDGLPSDPIKIAEDALGAEEDETEGG